MERKEYVKLGGGGGGVEERTQQRRRAREFKPRALRLRPMCVRFCDSDSLNWKRSDWKRFEEAAALAALVKEQW